jgi:alkaline phosphatase D
MTELTPSLARRDLFRAGALGLAGLAAPALAQEARGFTHGVASGEPGANRVLLWTRYAAAQDERLKWEVAEDEAFTRIAAQGDATASPDHDWCVKTWASGLKPGRHYWYRFVDKTGARSLTGRTRTLPQGRPARFRMAVFSCSNYGFGWFNAYAHAVEAGNFDLAVHLGDYQYEYKSGDYPTARQAHPERPLPPHETVTLAQYRERYAIYRSDPDLQRLHQMMPMVAMWDDHETANDAWQGGAENHQPNEGDWDVRKAAARRAWREWLPVSEDDYAAYEIGSLATLVRLDTRIHGRDKQLDMIKAVTSAKPEEADAALTAFRDGAWAAPERQLLGIDQEAWLAAVLKQSAASRTTWQVVAQQLVMGSTLLPRMVLDGLSANAPGWLKDRLNASVRAGELGLPWSMDMWSGYPAARERLYTAARTANANLVVLSGDSHNAWAWEHRLKGERVGVEFAGHSVTSPGAEGTLSWIKPEVLARELSVKNPDLKWCDTSQRGYMAVELTPASATSEWRFLASVRQKGTALAGTKRMTVLAGQRRFSA